MTTAEIQKQVEFYLGDNNLTKDDFFRDLITTNTDGYVDISVILKCNKIKSLGVNKCTQIVTALRDSKAIEVSADNLRIRRTGNAPLPARDAAAKKRVAKQEQKKAAVAQTNGKEEEAEVEEVERDDLGRVLFKLQDFDQPHILAFKTEDKDEAADTDYKVGWRDLETYIKANFDQVKVVYSRGDKYDGHIAVSKHKMNKA